MRIIVSGIDCQCGSAAEAAALLAGLIDLARSGPVVQVSGFVPFVQPPVAELQEMARRQLAAPKVKTRPAAVQAETRRSEVSEGRDQALLALMKAGPVTFGELQRKMPAALTAGLDEEQRTAAIRNALQRLKVKGTIVRAGQNWVLA
jgi:hypothetical protein